MQCNAIDRFALVWVIRLYYCRALLNVEKVLLLLSREDLYAVVVDSTLFRESCVGPRLFVSSFALEPKGQYSTIFASRRI